MRDRTIVAVHVYDPGKLEKTLAKIRPLLGRADEIWFTSPDAGLLKRAEAYMEPSSAFVLCRQVDNEWHDWSGYLETLRNHDGQDRLILCNDSIAARRIIGTNSLARFLGSFNGGPRLFVGELDRGATSVNLDGWSSCCWISTYLFGITGKWVDVDRLEKAVASTVDEVLADPDHFLNAYLRIRRSGAQGSGGKLRGKLGAMLLERWLTRCAVENGVRIVDFAAGSLTRRAEKFLERFLDD